MRKIFPILLVVLFSNLKTKAQGQRLKDLVNYCIIFDRTGIPFFAMDLIDTSVRIYVDIKINSATDHVILGFDSLGRINYFVTKFDESFIQYGNKKVVQTSSTVYKLNECGDTINKVNYLFGEDGIIKSSKEFCGKHLILTEFNYIKTVTGCIIEKYENKRLLKRLHINFGYDNQTFFQLQVVYKGGFYIRYQRDVNGIVSQSDTDIKYKGVKINLDTFNSMIQNLRTSNFGECPIYDCSGFDPIGMIKCYRSEKL